jgi:hypothetical protein
LGQSPLHAYWQHPRLNPEYITTNSTTFDLGTAVHDLFLRGLDDTAVIIDAADWRTKEAQTARDAARKQGLVPLLAKDVERVQAMVYAIRDQLAARDDEPALFDAGKPEQTFVFRDRGVLCRSRLDWLHDDYSAADDVKTTGVSANPFSWTRTTMWNIGADIEAVFHSRAVKAITGIEPVFRFFVIENQPPYASSIVSLAPSALALANDKVDRAIETWKRCLDSGIWPAYTKEICYAEAPPWSEQQWLEQQAIAEVVT